MKPNLTTKLLDQTLREWPHANRNKHDLRFAQYIALRYNWISHSAWNIESPEIAYEIIYRELVGICPWEYEDQQA